MNTADRTSIPPQCRCFTGTAVNTEHQPGCPYYAHLKEDARLRYELSVADYPGKKELQAENARLREELDIAREKAAGRGRVADANLQAELTRLRERNKALEAQYVEDVAEIDNVNAQRDTLLEAIREIATLCWNPAIGMPTTPYSKLHNIARSAIDEIEGES